MRRPSFLERVFMPQLLAGNPSQQDAVVVQNDLLADNPTTVCRSPADVDQSRLLIDAL